MEKDDIKRYSLDEIREMVRRGEDRSDRERLARESGIELDEDFWKAAKLVMPPPKKKSIHLRVDSDVLEWFRSQGRGYLSRMNAILRAYYESHHDPSAG
jgi:uncharacterized protein (DUF4415 family)